MKTLKISKPALTVDNIQSWDVSSSMLDKSECPLLPRLVGYFCWLANQPEYKHVVFACPFAFLAIASNGPIIELLQYLQPGAMLGYSNMMMTVEQYDEDT